MQELKFALRQISPEYKLLFDEEEIDLDVELKKALIEKLKAETRLINAQTYELKTKLKELNKNG